MFHMYLTKEFFLIVFFVLFISVCVQCTHTHVYTHVQITILCIFLNASMCSQQLMATTHFQFLLNDQSTCVVNK